MFSTLPKTSFDFLFESILSSANAFNLEESEVLSFGKELRTWITSNNSSAYNSRFLQPWAKYVLKVALQILGRKFYKNT